MRSQENAFGRARSATALALAFWLAACSGPDPTATRAHADEALARGDLGAAIIQYKIVLQSSPSDAQARVGLGRALLRRGDVSGALLELERARTEGVAPVEYAPWHAAALVEQGDFKRVIQTYGETRLEDSQAQALLKVEVARAWGGLRNAVRARTALDDALQAAPDNVPAQILLARLRGSAGDTQVADEAAETLVKSHPDRFDTWHLRADLHLALGRDDLALAAYERVIELRPTHMQSHVAIMRARLRAADRAAADAQLARMKQLAPSHPVTVLVEAELAQSRGDFARARELSQQLLRVLPDEIAVLLVAGAAESAMGSVVQAAAHFGKALSRDPGLNFARESMAAGEIRLGQYAKALETLRPIIGLQGATARALALAGEAQIRSGRPEAAESLFRRAVKMAPDETKLKAAALSAQIMSGASGQALLELNELAQRSTEVDAELVMYAAHMSRRNSAMALQVVDAMAQKRPQDAAVDQMRGGALAMAGDSAKARQAFEAALEKDPKLFAALEAIVELDLADGRLPQAEARVRKAIESEPQHTAAVLLLASVRQQAGAEPPEVSRLLADAVASDQRSSQARLAQIEYALSRRQFKDALAAAQDAVAALPGDTQILMAAATAQLRAGAVEQSASSFSQLAAARPDDAEPLLRLAEVYRVQGKLEQAAASYRRAIELPGAQPNAFAEFVEFLASTNKPAEALVTARRLRESRSARPEGYAIEASLLARQKRLDEAARILRLGVVNAPNTELVVMLHRVLVAQGANGEAVRVGRDWLLRHPGDSRVVFELATQSLIAGDVAAAEAGFRRVVQSNPRNGPALHRLAHILAGRASQEALAFAERAAAIAPADVAVLDTLAAAQAAAGRHAEALETQRRAIRLAPEDMLLRLGLARIALRGGDKSTARAEIDRLRGLGKEFVGHREVEALAKQL